MKVLPVWPNYSGPKRYWRLIAALLIIIVAVTPIVIVEYNAAQARGLVQLVVSLRIGQNLDLSDTRLNQFRSYRWTDTSSCQGNHELSQQFINPLLHRLHLAPGNQVDVTLTTHDGKLIEKTVGVFGEPRYGATLVQGESDTCGTNITASTRHREVIHSDHGPYFKVVLIREDHTVSGAQLDADWKIDLSCVASMHACSHPEEVLRSALASSTK